MRRDRAVSHESSRRHMQPRLSLTQRGAPSRLVSAFLRHTAHALLGPFGQPLAVWPMALCAPPGSDEWVDAKAKAHDALDPTEASQPAATQQRNGNFWP